MLVPKWMQSRDPGDPKTSTWVILCLKDSFSQRLLNMPAMRSFASRLITYHQHDSTTAWVRRATRQASGGCDWGMQCSRPLSLSGGEWTGSPSVLPSRNAMMRCCYSRQFDPLRPPQHNGFHSLWHWRTVFLTVVKYSNDFSTWRRSWNRKVRFNSADYFCTNYCGS